MSGKIEDITVTGIVPVELRQSWYILVSEDVRHKQEMLIQTTA
jgi:hypothetical protein